jgi:squalene synthase HpnC
MAARPFTAELQRHGPKTRQPRKLTLPQSRRYCQRLARTHYENFTVASRLLPRHLRQHFANVYAYCRWADDLADETAEKAESLALLDWWEEQLEDCYRGRTRHPVFTALAETIRQFEIPRDPLADLLSAFRQDQSVARYETFNALLDYCRRSANPVGRLVLYLGRCHQGARLDLSDSICTGLQLANFWQDVARDAALGRVYLPVDHLRRFGYDETMLQAQEVNAEFCRLMAFEVEEAEARLERGRPLVKMLPDDLQLPVALFIQGGLAVLAAIRRRNYDVWNGRPVVGRLDKLRILARCWWGLRRGTFVGDAR